MVIQHTRLVFNFGIPRRCWINFAVLWLELGKYEWWGPFSEALSALDVVQRPSKSMSKRKEKGETNQRKGQKEQRKGMGGEMREERGRKKKRRKKHK